MDRMADKLKLALAIGFVIAGVFGYYQMSESPLVVRVLFVIAGVAIGSVAAWFTEPGRSFAMFARESWEEGKRVTWPTRKEAMQTTGVVFAFVVVMALFLWVVDGGLLWSVKLLMGRGE